MTETVENLSRNNAGERKNTEPAELEPYLTREEVCRMRGGMAISLAEW
ncbi:MAG: hypothetical protein MJY58_05670 [Bacteroidaceae bacterium]|nr:hypothetical protein [Bacteroidaceae bacterium]